MASEPDLTRPVVLAGDSHVFAFASNRPGLSAAALVPMANERVDLFSVEGPFPRDLGYWAEVARVAEGRILAVCFSGSQHQLFLFAPSPLFDFVLASRPHLPLESAAQLLPEAMIRAFFRPTFAILDGLLREIAARGDRAYVVGTPPPKADAAKLREYVDRETGLVAMTRDGSRPLAELPFTPPLVRLKLWCVVQEMMAETARAHGAPFVDVPPETQDELGFLLPGFWVPDATHANTVYGELMLNRVLDRITA